MKTMTSWTLATALVLALGACNGNREADTAATGDIATPAADTAVAPAATGDMAAMPDATMPPAATDPNAMPGAAGMPTEGEALGTVVVIDQHEIDTAKQAQDKKVTGKTLDFAKQMIADHTKNMEQARALDGQNGVAIAMTGMADTMKNKGQTEMQRLAGMDGDAYAKAYVDAMVQGHTDALNALDTQLIPAAKDAQVKQFLTMTREAVAKHLDMAKGLQGNATAAAQ